MLIQPPRPRSIAFLTQRAADLAQAIADLDDVLTRPALDLPLAARARRRVEDLKRYVAEEIERAGLKSIAREAVERERAERDARLRAVQQLRRQRERAKNSFDEMLGELA